MWSCILLLLTYYSHLILVSLWCIKVASWCPKVALSHTKVAFYKILSKHMRRRSTFEDLVTRSKKMKTYRNSDTRVKSYSILNFSNTINYVRSVLFACVWRNRERLPINGSRGLVGLVFRTISTFVTTYIKFPISVVRWRLQFIAAALPRHVHIYIYKR
jgi:hypothetical protein